MSDSVRPHRLQPTRLLCPWDSPSKNTGVGLHFLLQGVKVKSESEVTQSCPTLSDPMDCSLPGSSVHGIFQARVLEPSPLPLPSPSRVQLLCDPVDYSPPGPSVHGSSQAKILKWVAISFSRGFPNPGIEPVSPTLADRFCTTEPPGKPYDNSSKPLRIICYNLYLRNCIYL